MKLGRSTSFSLFVLTLLSTAPAHAGDAPDPKKAEAAQRFDRGLSLFDDGDNAGALAEFKRTYELLPNPVVLYNIGLVYAAMGRPVDAVDALEKVLATPDALSPEKRERAKKTLEDQKARVGRLMVTTKPEGARIEIDNVEVAKTPLTAPLRVAEGNHIVGAVAEGYAPARKEVVIAGNSDASLSLELVETQGKQLANLTIQTGIRGAEVRVDGEAAGKTPLATSLTLVAGHHKVELKRPGYVSQTREIDLGEGATGELAFSLPVDQAALGSEGANLALESSDGALDVTVDGEHKGAYTGPLRLPRGPHHVSVVAAGFYPVERDVDLDGGQTNVVHVDLEPTPETRADYESSAHFHRTWGWIGIISGAVIAGGGTALAVISGSQKNDAQKRIDAANALAAGRTTPPCDARTGYAVEGGDNGAACNALLDKATNDYDSAKNKQLIGFVGIGVGAAVAITGVVLLVTGDDPNRYEHQKSHDLGESDGPRIALTPGPGQVGLGLGGVF
jgi:hypothetical protein